MTDKPPPKPPVSKPPPPGELERAHKEFEEACVATDVASKKHADEVAGLKKTISDPKFKAVRAPTASQLELEAATPKQ